MRKYRVHTKLRNLKIKTTSTGRTQVANLVHHQLERVLPQGQFWDEMAFPFSLGLVKPSLLFLQVEHLFGVADAPGTLHSGVEGFVDGIMDDPHIGLYPLPHLW